MARGDGVSFGMFSTIKHGYGRRLTASGVIFAGRVVLALWVSGCVQPMPPAASATQPNPGGAASPPPTQPCPAAARPQAASPMGEWRLASQPQSEALVGGHAWRWTVRVTAEEEPVDLELIRFDRRHHAMRVLDQPNANAGGGVIDSLMRAHGAVAGVNGGFFTPDFRPLGLMIAGGKSAGRVADGNLLGGIVLSQEGEPHLIWRDEFRGQSGVSDLIQAGPRLVDSGAPVAGLERTKSRVRTFIATDGGGLWIMGVARSTSLGALADILATPGLMPHLRVMRALNLDGGNSSALWMMTAERRVVSEPGWSTVRNYLAIVPR